MPNQREPGAIIGGAPMYHTGDNSQLLNSQLPNVGVRGA